MVKRKSGLETWHRLLEWDKAHGDAERLAASLLPYCGYEKIDPQNPMGGKDGKKDIICYKKNKKFVAAVYFPRGQKTFNKTLIKFEDDYKGVSKNKAEGFVFLTNQELKLGQRDKLNSICSVECEIIHLEVLTNLLNCPNCIGIRLEFLEIEASKEEQISFYHEMNEKNSEMISNFSNTVEYLKNQNKNKKEIETVKSKLIPIENHFPNILGRNSIATPQGSIEKLHKCERCHFGFLVEVYNPMFVLSPFGSVVNCAKCPSCGNIDDVSFY